MNLTGELVRDKTKGLGRIEAQDARQITVRFFSGGEERFPFPACFSRTLEPVDDFVQRELSASRAQTPPEQAARYTDEF